MRSPLVVAACLSAAALAPAALRAQTSPELVGAMQLAAEGRTDSARQVVAAVLARTRPGDSLYVEALYCRGRLGSNADSARHDLERVAIEFSNSRWADDALLQLTQLALTSGNPAGALGYAQRLRSDYPSSPLHAAAALWGGRAAFDAGQAPVACALLDSARAEDPGDIEFENQVAFFRSRCTSVALAPATTPAAAPDSAHQAAAVPAAAATPAAASQASATTAPAPTPATPPAARSPAPPAAAPYAVQVAATRTPAAAREVAGRMTRAGFTAGVLHGRDGYYRVQLGPYTTLAAARAAAQRASRLVHGRPFVVRR